MEVRMRASFLILIALLATAFLSNTTSNAQAIGHYVEGITGLDNCTAAPPGFFGSYMGYVNPVNSIKGPNGNTIARPDINVVAQFAAYN